MFGRFAKKGFKHHVKAARQVLRANWTGACTKPSPSLYPRPWNREAGFVAIGLAHFDQKKARRESRNGFICREEQEK